MAKVLILGNDTVWSAITIATSSEFVGSLKEMADAEFLEALGAEFGDRAINGFRVWEGAVEEESADAFCYPGNRAKGKIRKMKPDETFSNWLVRDIRDLLDVT